MCDGITFDVNLTSKEEHNVISADGIVRHTHRSQWPLTRSFWLVSQILPQTKQEARVYLRINSDHSFACDIQNPDMATYSSCYHLD
jgi:hypothetical protein